MPFTDVVDGGDPFSLGSDSFISDPGSVDPGPVAAGTDAPFGVGSSSVGGASFGGPDTGISGTDAPFGVGTSATQGATPDASGDNSKLLGAVGKGLMSLGGAGGIAGAVAGNPYGNAKVGNYQSFQVNRMSPGKQVDKSRPAEVANADAIEMHWIQRMRLFSGIYSQGKPTV